MPIYLCVVCLLGVAQGQDSKLELERLRPPQEAAMVSARLLEELAPGDAHLVISLSRQRAYLLQGEQLIIDSPISSGRLGAETPLGDFRVHRKAASATNPRYGAFYDGQRRVLRHSVSEVLDSMPARTSFRPTEVEFLVGVQDGLFAIYGADLPGYAASDRDIWLPAEIAKLIYYKLRLGSHIRVIE
ncbi:MAG: L,D-transpeptidase [Verrucomicrobiales bacterium]